MFVAIKSVFFSALQDEQVWGGGLFVFYHIFAFLEDAKERLNMPEMNKLFVHKCLYKWVYSVALLQIN